MSSESERRLSTEELKRLNQPSKAAPPPMVLLREADWEELLERLFHDDYENLKGKKLRLTRVRVPGRSIDFAHVISPSDAVVYQNLALNIGVHEGEDHTGQSIGIVRVTPWEAVVVATDVAVKAADVEVGFMDRFSGALIILGGLSQVMTAVEEVVKYFRDELHFNVCEIHKS